MCAFGMQQAHAQGRIVVEAGVGLTQLSVHLGREPVAFVGAIDGNQQHMATHFGINAALRVDVVFSVCVGHSKRSSNVMPQVTSPARR